MGANESTLLLRAVRDSANVAARGVPLLYGLTVLALRTTGSWLIAAVRLEARHVCQPRLGESLSVQVEALSMPELRDPTPNHWTRVWPPPLGARSPADRSVDRAVSNSAADQEGADCDDVIRGRCLQQDAPLNQVRQRHSCFGQGVLGPMLI